MSEMTDLQARVQKLEDELNRLKDNRLQSLTSTDVERMKGYLIERTATQISGAVSRYYILKINGKRGAIPVYDNFVP